MIDDAEPLLFHAGYRKLFPTTMEALSKVIPVERLRWIGGSHFEGDEYGALNEFLAVAPDASPFGTEVGVMTSINDFASRSARGFGDGEEFSIGSRRMKWLNTPHVPHGWDCGVLFDLSTETLLCGDLFTQPGAGMQAVTESEVLSASETMRGMMDYYTRDEHNDHPGATSRASSVNAGLPARERLSWRRRLVTWRALGRD